MMISSKILQLRLTRELKSSLQTISYKADKNQDPTKSADTLKQILTSSGRLSIIDCSQKNRLIAHISELRYFASLRKEFALNFVRIEKIHNALRSLSNENQSPAWILVTAYYLAFFSAVEVLRIQGTHSTYLSPSDINKINPTTGAKSNLEPGTYTGRASLTSKDGFKVILERQATSHHATVWKLFDKLLKSIVTTSKDLNSSEKRKLENLAGNTKAGIQTPSEIRNKWNYQEADYFGNRGEIVATEFLKIVSSPESTNRWFQQATNSSNESQQMCQFCYLMESLRVSVTKTHPLIVG